MKDSRLVGSALCRGCEANIIARNVAHLRLGQSRPLGRAMPLQFSRPRTRWHSTIREPRPMRSAFIYRNFLPFALVAGALAYITTKDSAPTLNDTTFTTYSITAREAITPTSFVLTISPRTPMQTLPYLLPDSTAWAHPLWSVEFKQPEVQIARHYTPLPPRDGDDPRDGTLRFYIRAIGDGEMSNYLGRLRPGQDVHLRGPHRGFDVLSRLGQKQRLVVLAGGTGVVPGLQAAEAVLGSREDTTVDLLWAIRKREELQQAAPPARSSWWSGPEPTEMKTGAVSSSPVGRQLEQMKSRYGDRLKVCVAVDEEGSTFSEKFLADVLKTSDGETPADDETCRLHSQALQRRLPEFETKAPACDCSGHGKNLVIVSGPDGFIGHYTGEKVWLGGLHTQGTIGGVAGRLQKRDPEFQKEWLVLKL